VRPALPLIRPEELGDQAGVRRGLGCEYDGPAEAFMALELRPGTLRGASGTVQYHAAFASL
jgi:putative acetyltransferase